MGIGSWRLGALAVRLFSLTVLGMGLLGCAEPGMTGPGGPPDPPGPPGPNSRRILFVGNSFTYTNELPEMVKALAKAAGANTLVVESVTFPGVSLEDHWNQGMALDRIKAVSWDLVIMQQGPSSQPDSRVHLLEYAERFDSVIRGAGSRPAFYMVWPDQRRPQDRDGVRDNYTAAADLTNGMLFPGGEAWRAAWRRDGSLALYSPDQLHPSRLGSYVVALCMVSQITGKPIVGMPTNFEVGGDFGYSFSVAPGIARLVQEAAAEAVRDYGRQ